MSEHTDINRERLELTAETERNRLAETLAALDLRRHEMQERMSPVVQLRRHVPQMIAVGGGLVIAAVAAGVVSFFRARSRRKQMYRERWYGLQRWWDHPERWARPQQPNVFAELGRKLVAGVIPVLLAEVAKRQIRVAELEAEGRPTPQGA